MTRVIVIGSGGHAKVVIDMLRLLAVEIAGVATADTARHGTSFEGIEVIGGDDAVLGHDRQGLRLVNGIGSTGNAAERRRIFDMFKTEGFVFQTLIHPQAWMADGVAFGEGSQAMLRSAIQPGCRIGRNAIINTGAVVDHDCIIGDHAHVAPGAILSGAVRVGDGAHIGTGACVIQGIEIGAGALVGAGAAVVRDVPPGSTVVGVPAREVVR